VGFPGVQAELGPLQLAWLGDAVWELHQRQRRCRLPGQPGRLHAAVVADVCAVAQMRALQALEPLLNPEERDWVRRGRNRAGRGPRHGDPGQYAQATGFETMIGWLFLRNPRRLAELLDHLETLDTLGKIDPETPSHAFAAHESPFRSPP
jgi:ribonuclease-3 family protein